MLKVFREMRVLQLDVQELKEGQKEIRNSQGDIEGLRRRQQEPSASNPRHQTTHGLDNDLDMMEVEAGAEELAAVEAAEARARTAMPAPRVNNVVAAQAAPPQQSGLDNSNARQLSRVMMDAITGLHSCVSSIEMPIEFIFLTLLHLYRPTGNGPVMLQRWEHFQEQGKLDFAYCWHVVLYLGHESERADTGGCFCRPKVNTLGGDAPYNRSMKCIRVKRDGGNDGKLCFWWGKKAGRCPDLTKLE